MTPRVIGCFAILLALGVILLAWASAKMRSGEAEAASIGVGTLKSWYSGQRVGTKACNECADELERLVPSPELIIADAYTGYPIGAYWVIISLGRKEKWAVVQFRILDGQVRQCFTGPENQPNQKSLEKAVPW